MKPFLADVNVLLAALLNDHVHHRPAAVWFDDKPASSIGVCRVVQLGVVRLLAQPAVTFGQITSVQCAWALVNELMEDERLEFLPEPATVDSVLPAFLAQATPNMITDAYLAAFATASARTVATFDRGFQRFHGLSLELLAA